MSKSVSSWGTVVAVAAGLGALAFIAKNSAPPLAPGVVAIYGRLVPLFGLRRPPPLVSDPTVANAESNGRDIRVNPGWLTGVLQSSCDTGACNLSFVAGLLAHELGHHWHREQGIGPSGHTEELEADRMAGAALRLLGYPQGDFQRILARLSGHGSKTHPAGHLRSASIQRGYYSSYG